jgi:hypothetical protein
MGSKKTSTFTLHHDRCNPAKWGLSEWQAFAHFAAHADLQSAACLSRAGLQLALSDHHAATGGTIEHIGWAEPREQIDGVCEMTDLIEPEEATPICAIYRGPTMYGVAYGYSHDGVECDGTEFEVFETEEAAIKFLNGLPSSAGDQEERSKPALSEGEAGQEDAAQ